MNVLISGRGQKVNNYRVLATDYETFSIEYQCLESAGSRKDGKRILVTLVVIGDSGGDSFDTPGAVTHWEMFPIGTHMLKASQ